MCRCQLQRLHRQLGTPRNTKMDSCRTKLQLMDMVEEAIMTQCSAAGPSVFLSTSYCWAACRGRQYTGLRSGRTAMVNQRPEVAGINHSEPSSAGTCPFPQLAWPRPAPPEHFTVSHGFLPLRNVAALRCSWPDCRANLHIRPQTDGT